MTQLVSPPNPQADFMQGSKLAPLSLGFLTKIVNAINGTTTARGVAQILLGNGVTISQGSGSPNGMVTGSPGDLYLNKSGGASNTLFVKESGLNTNTGWVAK